MHEDLDYYIECRDHTHIQFFVQRIRCSSLLLKTFRDGFKNFIDIHRYNFFSRYNVRWYIAPLYIQKTILFLLQRNTKNFTLNVGGFFVASIECFATV